MGFRIRRSIKILPGIRWNIGKKSGSLSIGGRGATVNFSKRGTRTTLGLPGTGISYSTTTKRRTAAKAQGAEQVPTVPQVFPLGRGRSVARVVYFLLLFLLLGVVVFALIVRAFHAIT